LGSILVTSEVASYVVRSIKGLVHLARWIIILDRLIYDCRRRQAQPVYARKEIVALNLV